MKIDPMKLVKFMFLIPTISNYIVLSSAFCTYNLHPTHIPQTELYSLESSWEHEKSVVSEPYLSGLLMNDQTLQSELLIQLQKLDNEQEALHQKTKKQSQIPNNDTLWTQIRMEAQHTLIKEPESGPQLYTHILSQQSLLHAVTSIVSHEISTQLIPATQLQNLFLEMLTEEDFKAISLDIMASALRSPSIIDGTALTAILFNQGLHALVCHRLSHRLWLQNRTGLAYYFQSTVSRIYSADIHPAAKIGAGIFLNAGSAGVVIGETAVIDDDVIILQGVTLGGTGKERGDRHPKVHRKAILQQSCSVLGNIVVGEGAIIAAKSICTKPVPPYTKVRGVPARFECEVSSSDDSEVFKEKVNEEWRKTSETMATGEEIKELLNKHFILAR